MQYVGEFFIVEDVFIDVWQVVASVRLDFFAVHVDCDVVELSAALFVPTLRWMVLVKVGVDPVAPALVLSVRVDSDFSFFLGP